MGDDRSVCDEGLELDTPEAIDLGLPLLQVEKLDD
jgi:hypothetical protein